MVLGLFWSSHPLGDELLSLSGTLRVPEVRYLAGAPLDQQTFAPEYRQHRVDFLGVAIGWFSASIVFGVEAVARPDVGKHPLLEHIHIFLQRALLGGEGLVCLGLGLELENVWEGDGCRGYSCLEHPEPNGARGLAQGEGDEESLGIREPNGGSASSSPALALSRISNKAFLQALGFELFQERRERSGSVVGTNAALFHELVEGAD